LDTSTTPLVARRMAAGDVAGSRLILHRAVVTGAVLSALIAVAAAPFAAFAAQRWSWVSAFGRPTRLMMFALPGLALGRIAVGVARGFRDMRNELYSRGLVETWVMIAVFVLAIAAGVRELAPATALIAGVTLGGFVAWWLADVRLRPDTRSPDASRPATS